MTTLPYPRSTNSRSGAVLIIVAAISALLLSMTLTFIVRMRSDVESSDLILREVQARIMLSAACNFIMERSRLGYDPKGRTYGSEPGVEAYGWLDVRNGQPGPQNDLQQPIVAEDATDYEENFSWMDLTKADRPALRCPMYVMKRPPFAIMPTVVRNPVVASPPTPPVLINPDPVPVVAPSSQANWLLYANGVKDLDLMRKQSSWFRVWRATANTFVVTCGAGETQGFKNWEEVTDSNSADLFGGNTPAGEAFFTAMKAQENYLYYLVEWWPYVAVPNKFTAAALPTVDPLNPNASNHTITNYTMHTPNATFSKYNKYTPIQANPVGTIRSIQRLLQEPAYW
jgi:hypothetical protein